MFPILIWVIIFIVSLAVLVKASDYFTDAAEEVGLAMGLPAFIVGVTIVAVGTSLPELVASIVAIYQGSPEIVVGNVIGSNIANIFLILGIAAIVSRPPRVKIAFELINVDLPMLVGSAFLFALVIWDGNVSVIEAILLLLGLVTYMVYTVRAERTGKDKEIKKEMKDMKKHKVKAKHIIALVVGAFFIYLGATWTIKSVVGISAIVGIATETIALSAVAFGTSLPEVMVTLAAARKNKPELAVGNVLGSNIFNTFGVMGVPALLGTLVIPQSILLFSLPVMIIATLMYFFITQDREITTWEGWMLIIFYVFFIGNIFGIL